MEPISSLPFSLYLLKTPCFARRERFVPESVRHSRALACKSPMSFLQSVTALRETLDIPSDVSVPAAVKLMTEMMGLPQHDAEGKGLPLPLQVSALVDP